MSETSDKAIRFIETECPTWVARGVSELSTDRALLHRAAEMLKALDDYYDLMDGVCFKCHRWSHEGHAPDCALAALLRKMPE